MKPVGSGARILAVEDQPASLALLRRILEPEGFDVKEARSGAEALALAQETRPDLVLLDMHLPDMHGLEVLRRMRESPWGAALAVVAVSAMATPEDRALWLQAGCADVIEKPIDPTTFARAISRFLPGGGAPREGDDAGARRPRDLLGEILVANGLVTRDQLAQAIQAQVRSGKRLGQILVEQGVLTEDDIAWALSAQLGYPYVFLTQDLVDVEAVRLLPESFLRERRVLPVLKFAQEMTLAMADPTDQGTIDEVAARTGLRINRALALASNITEVLDQIFARPQAAARETPAAAPEVQYFQFHLMQALQEGATEIHFDAGPDGQGRIRYRIHGTLVDRTGPPGELHAAILDHLHRLTGQDPGPGVGMAEVSAGGVGVCLVAAFVPTAAGPAATVALYPQRTDAPDLGVLGIAAGMLDALHEALRAPRGLVVIGCPDRATRATLLHGLLPAAPQGKVWTVETLPVFRRPTINQTLTTPDGVAAQIRLVAAARADLIGVDDAGTPGALAAAAEAARGAVVLVGHPQAAALDLLAELTDGLGPAATASVLRGVLTAHPVRLLCPACKQVGPAGGDGRRRFAPVGCEACGFTGYRGQRALAQVWVADPKTRALLRAGQRAEALVRAAGPLEAQLRAQALALLDDGLVAPGELSTILEGTGWTSPSC
ncbi:MAG: response regulator [Armatimonadota bacterium]|nr:response regulator [Armatimonadota bacterium]MDR7537037.1 response regulator [Armatimonadota bacterium]